MLFSNCWEERLWHRASLFKITAVSTLQEREEADSGFWTPGGGQQKRWRAGKFQTMALKHTCSHSPVGFLFTKQHKNYYLEGGKKETVVVWLELTKRGVESRPYVLNSPPETEGTVTEPIWSPYRRIKPPLLTALGAAHVPSLTSSSCNYLSAFPRKLVLSTWQLPSDPGRSQWHVNGQPHGRRCASAGKQSFVVQFPRTLPKPPHSIST